MSSDKLSRTARAAGFAMACDDLAGPAVRRSGSGEPQGIVPRSAAPVSEKSPGSSERESAFAKLGLGINLTGWSFWKTA